LRHGRHHHLLPPVGSVAIDIDGALDRIKEELSIEIKKSKTIDSVLDGVGQTAARK
jgi:hypothetical protein